MKKTITLTENERMLEKAKLNMKMFLLKVKAEAERIERERLLEQFFGGKGLF